MAKSGGKIKRSASNGRFVTERKAAASSKTHVSEARGSGSTHGAHRSAITGKFVGQTAAARLPNKTISASDSTPARDGKTGRFTVGAQGMGKLNAIEGISLSRESRAMFSDFERQGLSTEERRAVIIAKHTIKR